MFKEGVINVNKPAGWTSQDVCAKLRGRLHIKRIGHTGTLDPMATGVLPICIGKATRIIEYYDKDVKSYRATFKLGIETDTLDITGEVIKTSDYSNVTEADVINTCKLFVGDIKQIPPKYSAIKINGKRAYELAREGKAVDIKPRNITIHSIDIVSINLVDGVVAIDVSCSKGTYIRTLCDDIGCKLGCGATMTDLVRTSNGCFNIGESVELNDLIEMSDEEINNTIISVETTLVNLGEIEVDNTKREAFLNGNSLTSKSFKVIKNTSFDNLYKVSINSIFQGIATLENTVLVPKKVISIDNN